MTLNEGNMDPVVGSYEVKIAWLKSIRQTAFCGKIGLAYEDRDWIKVGWVQNADGPWNRNKSELFLLPSEMSNLPLRIPNKTASSLSCHLKTLDRLSVLTGYLTDTALFGLCASYDYRSPSHGLQQSPLCLTVLTVGVWVLLVLSLSGNVFFLTSSYLFKNKI